MTYTHLKAKETSFSDKGESVAERSCDFRGHRAEDLVGSRCDHGLSPGGSTMSLLEWSAGKVPCDPLGWANYKLAPLGTP